MGFLGSYLHAYRNTRADFGRVPGLIHKPACDACAHAVELRPQAPSAPPPRFTFTRGRRRQVDTQLQFCPDPAGAYYGGIGCGHLLAHGHPGGKPWRHLYGLGCQGYFQETPSPPLHGKRILPKRLVWAVGALAEGLGIRAVARVFEVDPNTVLHRTIPIIRSLQVHAPTAHRLIERHLPGRNLRIS
jgi:hypothetical protein